MSMPRSTPKYTEEEYLALERASEERHIYLDGEIFAMAGESGEHGDVSTNLTGLFYNQLKGTPCRARAKETKVRSGPPPKARRKTSGMYSYPDLVVVCNDPEYLDAYRDVIVNPKVIVEVLSPSTEAFDRGKKFARYQEWNPSLTDYLLVSQNRPQIEHHHRKADDSWSAKTYTGLEATVAIPSIRCTLKLADVYDRITFPEA